MILAASLFTIGIGCFIYAFIRHGLPNDEALGNDPAGEPEPSPDPDPEPAEAEAEAAAASS